MAGRKKRIVAINYKGDFLCCCDSIKEMCEVNGFTSRKITESLNTGCTYRCMKFIEAKVYSEHYMAGTTHLLGFKTRKERLSERSIKAFRNLSPEKKEERSRKISESQKRRVKLGCNPLVNKKLRSRKVICIQTGAVYDSMKAAADSIGTCYSAISNSVKTGYKVKGLNFKCV